MKMGLLGCALGILLVVAAAPTVRAEEWSPFPVFSWEPAFNQEGKRSEIAYERFSGKPSKKWQLCASIPHLKDAYWLAVNYGLVDEAERNGIAITIHEAGGYDRGDVQNRQIKECIDQGVDALIVSSVSLDNVTDMMASARAKGIPIIDLINGMTFPDIQARSAGDYYDNGFETGRFILDRHAEEGREITVLWFPGPKAAGWAQRGDQGFIDAIQGTNIKLLAAKYGDTGKKTQGELVRAALEEHPDVDYIVGTTVTAEAAVSIVRRKRIKERTKVMAYYFGPGVHRGIQRGTIIAAPSDQQAIQARIAVDQAVRILEGQPYLAHVGPKIGVIEKGNLDAFDLSTSLAPRGFKPIFDVN